LILYSNYYRKILVFFFRHDYGFNYHTYRKYYVQYQPAKSSSHKTNFKEKCVVDSQVIASFMRIAF